MAQYTGKSFKWKLSTLNSWRVTQNVSEPQQNHRI